MNLEFPGHGFFAAEGPNYPHPGELGAQRIVNGVHAPLESFVACGEHRGTHQNNCGEHRDNHEEGEGEDYVLPDGHEHPAHAHNRGRHHNGEGHERDHLDLVDVVRGAGDQGGGSETLLVRGGEALHMRESFAAQLPAQVGGDQRPVIDRPDSAEHLREGEEAHEQSARPNIGAIAFQNAVIDNVSAKRGEGEPEEHLRDL